MVTSKRKLAYDEPVIFRARGNMTISWMFTRRILNTMANFKVVDILHNHKDFSDYLAKEHQNVNL